MITCRELTEIVTDYAEGRLPLRDRLRLHFHLGLCRHCRRYLRQMAASVRATGTLRTDDVPPEVLDALRRAFADVRGGQDGPCGGPEPR